MSDGDILYMPDDGTGKPRRCIELSRRRIGASLDLVRVLVVAPGPSWETCDIPADTLSLVPRERVRYHGGDHGCV